MKQAPVPRRQGAKPAAAMPGRGRKWDRIMIRLLIIGPPGSGKGTQAEQLARHFGIPAVSTGEIFRSNVSEETELGNQAASYLDGGDFVPDHLTNALVRDRLVDSDLQEGFLLDGYPRTAPQVQELDTMLANQGFALDAVIELHAPDAVLEQRMRRRAADQGRSDDTVDVFRRRLDLYHRETHEVVSVYAGRGILVSVDGSGEPGDITGAAITAVEKFLRGRLSGH
ncbi:Adenylate kinase [Pseudarthrobacter phenanthrenivorans Sphe3]|uniref:Adenylate kinase n=2 Tax=Pseudarthrobacter phenanthrenivorans TaxID=361575 RepID=F0M3Y7_PSEPM|nr:Adenylate kinase [Pseudarthrobacter phenanthrenivorans Sphe3]